MPCEFQLHHLSRDPGCQFKVPEDQLLVVEGSTASRAWCKFHLPLTTDRGEALKAAWDQAQTNSLSQAILAHVGVARNENRVADLSGVVFPPGSDLRDSRRRLDLPAVSFRGAAFGGDIIFRSVNFGGDTDFSSVMFGGRADFRRASFQRNVLFESAVFAGVAEFRDARFSRAVRFKKARFDCGITFHRARFEGLAEFQQAKFCEAATFDEAAFGGAADFKKAEFDGDARFFGTPLREGPAGGADTFRRSVAFQGTRFKRQAIFTNRRFLDKTDFRNAVFAVAPEFHDCTLHEGTSFAGARFLDRISTEHVDAVSAYRTLKLKMAGMRATDEEALFYSLEQRSLRASADVSMSVKIASWLYEQTADYGRSFLRPLVWLGGSFVAFDLVYFAALTGQIVTWADVRTVLHFGMQQVFQPFYIFRTGEIASGQAVPLWLAFMAAVHSISTFSFLALFLLALRRRFRLH